VGELAVVTGCDSGIGAALRRRYAAEGFDVLASFLTPPHPPSPPGLFSARMDLRSAEEVASFAAEARALAEGGRRLALLVLNAGTAAVGAVEDLELEEVRRVFEVNFFGNLALLRALLPLVRRDGARICLVSSAAGRIALPYFSPYACSKFALEALGDCLRRELSPLGVRTILFEPRAVATPIWRKTWDGAEAGAFSRATAAYGPGMRRGGERLVEDAERGMDPDAAAERIVRLSLGKNPAPRYVVTRHPLAARIQFALPARLADRIIAGIFS
jgi:NAD(P)-dependent dehydrogenase (short-subunit alcohol dehydrogenase family)